MIGVDEVGRGCLAGPLLVVATRQTATLPEGLKDSKLLSRKQREQLLNKLSNCCEFGEGWVGAREIDKLGLAACLRLGVKRALGSLGAGPDEQVILDGSINYAPKKYKNVTTRVRADSLVPVVAAASVIAKVTRDRYMMQIAKKHPHYDFESHVGYGTAKHLLALENYGPVKLLHRLSFAPLSQGANK